MPTRVGPQGDSEPRRPRAGTCSHSVTSSRGVRLGAQAAASVAGWRPCCYMMTRNLFLTPFKFGRLYAGTASRRVLGCRAVPGLRLQGPGHRGCAGPGARLRAGGPAASECSLSGSGSMVSSFPGNTTVNGTGTLRLNFKLLTLSQFDRWTRRDRPGAMTWIRQ